MFVHQLPALPSTVTDAKAAKAAKELMLTGEVHETLCSAIPFLVPRCLRLFGGFMGFNGDLMGFSNMI